MAVSARSCDFADVFEGRHLALLNKLVLDARFLIEEWATTKQGVPDVYDIGRKTIHSAFQISHAAQQLYFSGSPFFAHPDNASESATALVRVALETRLRFGFGVLGCTNKSSGAFVPLNMKHLLKAIGTHEASISFSVPLGNLRRIYEWSNTYIHTGLRDYVWLPRFAEIYLNGFFQGGRHDKGKSVFAGIVTTRDTVVDAVQHDVEQAIAPDTLELVRIPVELCDVVLKA